VAAGLFGILDRTAQTAFFVNEHGGSSYLWQNLFWFFGHPEVYIMALPGFGIVAEIFPAVHQKTALGYRIAAAGMIGVSLLSFFVWRAPTPLRQRDQPRLRPAVHAHDRVDLHPDGFIFLNTMGTLWKAKIRYEVPMLFALPWVQLLLAADIRCLSLRRPRRCHRSRELLSSWPTSTTRSWGDRVRLLRWPVLLAAENDRKDDGQAARESGISG